MGIKGLAKLLSDEAPLSLKEVPLSHLHGRKLAIDASMAIYQFLIAVRSGGPGGQNAAMMLTNADGETTSHIQGIFNRTIRFISEGIRPVYVFDGKPPQFKSGELLKRREKRLKAEQALKAAEESGNIEEQDKQSKRLVRAGTKENEDCIKLLTLMGVPVIRAPCEAEAQAAALARSGKVYAAATEDMDALTFRSPVMVRKMTFANASKSDVQQIFYDKAIEGLEITHDQFVDLCILLGCDYCDTIKGIGPKTALKLIREHKNIETILKHLNREKYVVPDIYVEARRLFNHHEVLPDNEIELKWTECQPEPLKSFLVDEMGFNPDRVQASIEKLQKAFKASAKPQSRMDSFFKVKANPEGDKKKAEKRKAELAASRGKGKKGKGGGGFKKK
ncbi:exonuclease [Thalassiosira pseudonana CCMP1335]|uniref:Flap endonuclease 1 n=1 Tax=Thalassiosira pseudonana TaxID=35128 RepID=FEN1_THAPS|nr:exonuclease [Thalassiosira pseudonana CCMP1335]B8C6S5.1 RecName: Full=Flap endonuclease 1; Short=FEN-1; AltName: Full=Flap structure-specific endonuclease 1 [Thalassiosira pseudonana]EED90855.1 exonuclease [Thalassiosira pseudonana CCMP1335]